MKNLFEFLTNAIHKSEAAYIAGMSLGECENLAGEIHEKFKEQGEDKKYNTICSVYFSVNHNGLQPVPEDVIAGLKYRLGDIMDHGDEVLEVIEITKGRVRNR